MRIVMILVALTALGGCTRWAMNSHLDNANRAYALGDCDAVLYNLSKVDRESRSRRYVQPEVSMLRGQCLERQKFYVDAVQTYQYIVQTFPNNEYAFRAKARLDTLRQLGYDNLATPAVTQPVSR